MEEYGAAGVITQADACCARGGIDDGARRRRRDSMDSKGSAPVSTAIAGTAFARLGILTLDVLPPDAAPYSIVLAWKRVEPNRDWLKAGSNEPAREGGKNRAKPRRTWLTFGLQFSGESISSGNKRTYAFKLPAHVRPRLNVCWRPAPKQTSLTLPPLHRPAAADRRRN